VRIGSTMAPTHDDAIALHGSYPSDDLLPVAAVRAALARAARGHDAWLRPPVAGLPDLRTWFATELARAVQDGGAPPTASDVRVVSGGQSGIARRSEPWRRPVTPS